MSACDYLFFVKLGNSSFKLFISNFFLFSFELLYLLKMNATIKIW
jgi:hypothetical protein